MRGLRPGRWHVTNTYTSSFKITVTVSDAAQFLWGFPSVYLLSCQPSSTRFRPLFYVTTRNVYLFHVLYFILYDRILLLT